MIIRKFKLSGNRHFRDNTKEVVFMDDVLYYYTNEGTFIKGTATQSQTMTLGTALLLVEGGNWEEIIEPNLRRFVPIGLVNFFFVDFINRKAKFYMMGERSIANYVEDLYTLAHAEEYVKDGAWRELPVNPCIKSNNITITEQPVTPRYTITIKDISKNKADLIERYAQSITE